MAKRTQPEKATPYQLGERAAADRQPAYETHNAFPPDDCPFDKGTPEEAEYDRGWKAAMAEFRRRGK
jgi:hypothetical protein